MIVNAHDEDQGVAEKIGENIAQSAGKRLTVNGYHRGVHAMWINSSTHPIEATICGNMNWNLFLSVHITDHLFRPILMQSVKRNGCALQTFKKTMIQTQINMLHGSSL